MTVTAVAFDLDDTLAVPTRDRQTLLDETTDAVGRSPLSRAAYLDAHGDHLTGETREPIFDALVDDVDPGEMAREYRRRVTAALVPVEGVESMLSELRSTYRLGLLTNGPTVAQRVKLEALGWTDAFDTVCISGDLDAGKPDTRAFEALLAALGSDAETTVYVGNDPAADVTGAADAGLAAVQVTFSGGPEPNARAAAHVDRSELATALPELLESL